jgi:hypothetical protein
MLVPFFRVGGGGGPAQHKLSALEDLHYEIFMGMETHRVVYKPTLVGVYKKMFHCIMENSIFFFFNY